jgi:hypothetical protein
LLPFLCLSGDRGRGGGGVNVKIFMFLNSICVFIFPDPNMKNPMCSSTMSKCKGFIKKYFLEGKIPVDNLSVNP